MINDVWSFWRRALANPAAIGRELPIHPDTPEVGYFRFLDKRAGKWIPCAFFVDDEGLLRCQVDGHEIEPLKFGDTWHRVCEHPVGYDEYARAVAGLGWDDEPPPPMLGHNLSADQHEQLLLEMEEAVALAQELLAQEITSQNVADRAAILSKRLSEIRRRADDEHGKEKRPALEESRRIDDRWRFREGVTETVTRLKRHLESWLDTHESAGRTGARVSLRTVTLGRITDYDLFIENTRHRVDVIQFFETLATKMAKSGTIVPGMELFEEKKAV